MQNSSRLCEVEMSDVKCEALVGAINNPREKVRG
jgi:hypothetical protein